MPDRQDTRPPPEADARRDAAATAMLTAPAEPARPAVDALFRVLEEAERIWAPVSALHAAADAEATAAGITIGSAEKANLPAWQAYSAAWAETAPRIDELCVLAAPFMEQPAETLDDLVLKHRISLTLDQYEGAAVTDLDRLAKAWSPAAREPAPPFSAAAEVSLAHMVVDYFGSEEIHPFLNSDIALRDRARAILAGAAPTSAGTASAPAAQSDAAIIALADAASLEELTAGIRCNAAEDPPKGEDGPSFFDRSYDLLEQVTATRPSTLAGIAAKARVMLTHVGRGAASDRAHDLGSDHAVCTLALSIAHDAVRLDRGAGSGGTVAAQSDGEDASIHVCAQELIEAFARLDRAERAGKGMEISEEELARLQEPVFALMKRLEGAEARTWPGMALKCLVLAVSEWFQVGYNTDPADDDRNQKIARCFRDHAFAGDLRPLLATGRALPASNSSEADTALRRAIGAHVAAHRSFVAATPAADEVLVAEAGGDDSEAAMAPAVAARDAANEAALEAWRDLFRHRPGSLDGLLALLRHAEQHHADHIGTEDEPDVFGYLVESITALLLVAAPPARGAVVPDPIFDALNACRAPEAELEAFDTEHGGEKAGPGYTIERDMTVFNAAADAWDRVFTTMPTTQDGRFALLGFIESRVERGAHRDGSPQDGEGTVFDRAYRALARIIRTERIETGFDLSKLTTLQLSNYHDAFEASAVSWLYISNAGWAEDAAGIAEAEYDRHARMRSAVAAEIKLRDPADDWDGDVRLAALIRDEMLCNGSLRHAPALRAAIAQRWGAAA